MIATKEKWMHVIVTSYELNMTFFNISFPSICWSWTNCYLDFKFFEQKV